MQVGVNLSGGEFGSGSRMNYDYTYPTHSELDYYASKGLDVVRLPVLWERLQPSQNGALSTSDIGRIADVVHYADTKGMKVILDVHNYGYGYGSIIGSSATPNASFADLWGKLAGQFATDSNVIFGLMNEPHTQSAAQWLDSANLAIDAIRRVGATQEILVPGSYWDGAWSWVSSDNDTVMGNGIRDSAHNYAFEVHQYLDVDGSGTHASVVSETVGVERLSAITAWAAATGNKLFLGEFGAGTDVTSLSALDKMLGFMNAHQDVWQGATEWGGGPWWGNYMYSVEPTGLNTSSVTDKPQIAILSKYATMPDPAGQELHGSAAPVPASVAPSYATMLPSSSPVAPPVSQHPNHSYVEPLSVSDLLSKPSADTLGGLVDYDGNHLGSAGVWKLIGQADVQNDGDVELVYLNKELGRWATLGPDETGTIDLANHGAGGDTRIVGIYIDPFVASGQVPKGSPNDSQTRFASDLKSGNIDGILGGGDFDRDGFQEIYFHLANNSAVLHAYMHSDGNIQYANYQNADQMHDYMSSHGFGPETWGHWM